MSYVLITITELLLLNIKDIHFNHLQFFFSTAFGPSGLIASENVLGQMDNNNQIIRSVSPTFNSWSLFWQTIKWFRNCPNPLHLFQLRFCQISSASRVFFCLSVLISDNKYIVTRFVIRQSSENKRKNYITLELPLPRVLSLTCVVHCTLKLCSSSIRFGTF